MYKLIPTVNKSIHYQLNGEVVQNPNEEYVGNFSFGLTFSNAIIEDTTCDSDYENDLTQPTYYFDTQNNNSQNQDSIVPQQMSTPKSNRQEQLQEEYDSDESDDPITHNNEDLINNIIKPGDSNANLDNLSESTSLVSLPVDTENREVPELISAFINQTPSSTITSGLSKQPSVQSMNQKLSSQSLVNKSTSSQFVRFKSPNEIPLNPSISRKSLKSPGVSQHRSRLTLFEESKFSETLLNNSKSNQSALQETPFVTAHSQENILSHSASNHQINNNTSDLSANIKLVKSVSGDIYNKPFVIFNENKKHSYSNDELTKRKLRKSPNPLNYSSLDELETGRLETSKNSQISGSNISISKLNSNSKLDSTLSDTNIELMKKSSKLSIKSNLSKIGSSDPINKTSTNKLNINREDFLNNDEVTPRISEHFRVLTKRSQNEFEKIIMSGYQSTDKICTNPSASQKSDDSSTGQQKASKLNFENISNEEIDSSENLDQTNYSIGSIVDLSLIDPANIKSIIKKTDENEDLEVAMKFVHGNGKVSESKFTLYNDETEKHYTSEYLPNLKADVRRKRANENNDECTKVILRLYKTVQEHDGECAKDKVIFLGKYELILSDNEKKKKYKFHDIGKENLITVKLSRNYMCPWKKVINKWK